MEVLNTGMYLLPQEKNMYYLQIGKLKIMIQNPILNRFIKMIQLPISNPRDFDITKIKFCNYYFIMINNYGIKTKEGFPPSNNYSITVE